MTLEKQNIPGLCCFKACSFQDEPLIQIEVFHPDKGSGILQAHEKCCNARCHPNVRFDDPRELRQIPRDAKCFFCGDPLPKFGRHPYCFDVGKFTPPHRYWAHSRCIREVIIFEKNGNTKRNPD
jgi:hypothetical protein